MNPALKKWLRRWLLILFTALSGGFCVLFYGSLGLEKRALWFALGYCVVLLPVCRLLPRFLPGYLPRCTLWGFWARPPSFGCHSGRRAVFRQGSWQQSLYAAPQKVLFVVPHQDDDLNLAAGVIDAYRAAGTQVKVLFEQRRRRLSRRLPPERSAALPKSPWRGSRRRDLSGLRRPVYQPLRPYLQCPAGELVPSDAGTHPRMA